MRLHPCVDSRSKEVGRREGGGALLPPSMEGGRQGVLVARTRGSDQHGLSTREAHSSTEGSMDPRDRDQPHPPCKAHQRPLRGPDQHAVLLLPCVDRGILPASFRAIASAFYIPPSESLPVPSPSLPPRSTPRSLLPSLHPRGKLL